MILQLARIARRLRPALKVLLSSGDLAESDVTPDEFSFIAKPYRPAELAAKLKKVLATQ
jgi:hypothetical protein